MAGLGVLDTPLTWRETPQEDIGDVQQRQATFVAPTPHGPVTFFVNGYMRPVHGQDGHGLIIDFGKDVGWTDDRIRDVRRRWANYQRRNPRRRSIPAYLKRARRPDDLAYYTRFMAARRHVSYKAFTIISTIASIVQDWVTDTGVRYVAYEPSDAVRARLYYTMVRLLAPKARIANEPEDEIDHHVWDLRP